jgi:DNA-binding MarR family transcriptional regulator
MVAAANTSHDAPIYSARSFRSREAVGALVALTRKALIEEFERELAPLGLNAAQALVIVVLADEGAGTAAEICKYLSHDPGAMTRLIDKLETMALVRRVRGREDRRSARLEVTQRGRALRSQVTQVQVNVLNRMLRGFSRAEARLLERFLKRMLGNAAQLAVE